MLHLESRVHLQEIEILVFADHKLHGACTLVFHRLGQGHRLLTHGLAGGLADEGRRCFLDHLLMAPLDRALTFPQIHHVAVRITQHLNFDVARLEHILFDEHPVIAKAVARFIAAGGKPLMGLLVIEGHAKALATAAGTGLDHDGVADAACNLNRLLGRIDGVVVAGDGADLGLAGQLLRSDLVAHGGNGIVLRADEDDAFFLAALGEGFVFGQEAVTRMYRLCASLLAGRDDLVSHQIGLARRRWSQQHRLVGEFHMARVLVGLGIHGHRGDAHLACGLDHTASDLAAVGNQNLLEHARISPVITAECSRACATGFPAFCP